MAWMKTSWSSAFIASLWLNTLGFAFVPVTKSRGWILFISPLDSEESYCSNLVCIGRSNVGGCGIPGGD
eukprot:2770980-Ditylum_brightwellii.AAC.1